MSADLKEAVDAEKAAVKKFDELIAAKTKEVNALTKMIEEKLERSGTLAVEIQEMKNDLGDTAEGLEDDKKFLQDLDKNCAEKTKLFEENVKYRTQELAALADTIKVLNDDDALELFKKTLPAPEASFLQVEVTTAQMRARALSMINALRRTTRRPEIDFIALSLRGKKIGFEKVLKMIDDMVAQLKKEQVDDDTKKDYCNEEFDTTEDKIKDTTRTIGDLEAKMADEKEAIASLADDIKALQDGIAALDKQVAEATQQRKEENAEYTETLAANNAAIQLIELARNRMNKFYNPKLYKAPPKRELSEEDRITLNMGGTITPTAPPGGIAGTGITALDQGEVSFVQVRAHETEVGAPPPPPEADLAYKKGGETSNGVIRMMDILISDVENENTEMETDEKNAQEEYEATMEDAKKKRAQDSKAITEKEGAKAAAEASLQQDSDTHAAEQEELASTNEYLVDLHNECDWLLDNFDARKAARTDEIESLGKAKAVLAGADYSLLQMSSHTHRLRR